MIRCAAYARYSTDKQNPVSVSDQIRICRKYAERQGWEIPDRAIYSDAAVSGTSADRPALRRLLAAVKSSPRPFDVLLVDDTSRLSRNQADVLRIHEQLAFAGIRFVAVSQGIDSAHEQADLMVGVHGIFDQLYVKELAKKTHRGLEGRALRGLHTGGRIYGYNSIEADGGKRLEVNQTEAAVVRRIFEMSAEGAALKTIAKTLNAEAVPPPRARKGRQNAGWCPSAIREMLYNSSYSGRIIWNRTKFVKVPGTNKRVARPRPPEEWHTDQDESLRVISEKLWVKVHKRLLWLRREYGKGRKPGLLSRNASSPYLLSGLLVCSECGGKLIIVAGQGKGRHPRYGCPRNFYRGTCSNDLRERQDRLEARLLEGLQEAVLKPEAIDYTLNQFEKELTSQLRAMSGKMDAVRKRKAELETELRRLTAAVAESGHSAFLLEAITERERELRNLTERTLSGEPGSVRASVDELRRFVHCRLADVRKLLCGDTALARQELALHVDSITLKPSETNGRRYYVATGNWSLIEKEVGPQDEAAPLQVRMVAGAGFEPATFGL